MRRGLLGVVTHSSEYDESFVLSIKVHEMFMAGCEAFCGSLLSVLIALRNPGLSL